MTNTKTDATCPHCNQNASTESPFHPSRCAKDHGTKTDASLEKQENQALQRADDKSCLQASIDYLGAQEVAPRVYAHLCDHENCTAMGIGPQSHEGPRWFILPPGAMELLAEDLRTGTTSQGWCSLKGDPVMLPAWWSPDRQYACVDECHGTPCPYSPADPCKACDDECDRTARITCDLTTGAEIPC